jgi:hypothetical protein
MRFSNNIFFNDIHVSKLAEDNERSGQPGNSNATENVEKM